MNNLTSAKFKADFVEQALAVRSGKEMDLSLLEKSMPGIIDSAIANPQTHIWLLNTDPADRTDTDYCVAMAKVQPRLHLRRSRNFTSNVR